MVTMQSRIAEWDNDGNTISPSWADLRGGKTSGSLCFSTKWIHIQRCREDLRAYLERAFQGERKRREERGRNSWSLIINSGYGFENGDLITSDTPGQ